MTDNPGFLAASDILDCIAWIERYTADRTFDEYLESRQLRDLVERNLLTISEASKRLPEHLKQNHAAVPWRQVADLGNWIRHRYRDINQPTVWGIVQKDLPELKRVAEAVHSALKPRRIRVSDVRAFTGDMLVIASHNSGKVREIAELLGPYVRQFASAGELGLPEPEETGASFVENAELKARAAASGSGRVVLADDSGLAVHALGGEPGIYSARWAGPGKNFSHAMERVQRELGDSPDRRAHFVCALSLAWPDGHCETVEGVIHGSLIWPPRGDRGFGYDPMFVADGYDVTFGEMEPDRKHRISHRADAFKKLVERCFR